MIAVRISLLFLWSFGVVFPSSSSNSNVTLNFCGQPTTNRAGVEISFYGSASGVKLAQAWVASYHSVCQNANTSTFQITVSSSARSARRICATAATPTLDVAILCRSFQTNEAKAITVEDTDDFHFQCSKGDTSRTILQAHVATNAFVLVTAPNGIASYCIKQFFNNGLSLQQLRALYSNYGPTRIFNISTLSPSMSPSSSLFPSYPLAFSPPPTFGPGSPTPTKPHFQIQQVPTPTTRRPTLPPGTRRTVFWGSPAFRPQTAALPKEQASSSSKAQIDCSQEQALVAGPPITLDLYQDFARTILSEFDQGEQITPSYMALTNINATISFLQNHTNAIALVSLPEYRANQGRLAAVNINDSKGRNRIPSTSAIRSRQYPLSFNEYMAVVDSFNNTRTKFVRALLLFGYSTSDGDKDVAQAGLVPLSRSSKVVWMDRLSQPT